MSKTCKLTLWVSLNKDRGQKSRPCVVEYTLAPPLKGVLYQLLSVTDKHTQEEYPLEGTDGVLALNGNLDEAIAAADPKQVAFAKKELGTDLKNPPKKSVKKPVKKTKLAEDEDGLPIFL